jgi:hypothetical protein
LGLTAAPGDDSTEWLLATTFNLFHPRHEWTLFAGRRGYFGYEQLKTFLDFSLFTQLRPYFSIGPRVGAGIHYDLGPLFGIWSGAFLQLGGGEGLLFTGSIAAGIQLRSYWLEN